MKLFKFKDNILFWLRKISNLPNSKKTALFESVPFWLVHELKEEKRTLCSKVEQNRWRKNKSFWRNFFKLKILFSRWLDGRILGTKVWFYCERILFNILQSKINKKSQIMTKKEIINEQKLLFFRISYKINRST